MLLIIKKLLLPPGINLLVILAGLVLLASRLQRLAIGLIGFGAITLYLLATPWVGNALLSSLEQAKPIQLATQQTATSGAKAIVILTAGSHYAPEFGGSAPSSTSLLRAYYAAHLYKITHLPIIISGGLANNNAITPESTQMKRLLEQTFNVPVWKLEPYSRNTYQNAVYTAKILKAQHIKRFYLVTSAWHLPRALWCFRQQGLDPIPAPTDFGIRKPINWRTAILPDSRALVRSYYALHEYLGMIWYRIRYS